MIKILRITEDTENAFCKLQFKNCYVNSAQPVLIQISGLNHMYFVNIKNRCKINFTGVTEFYAEPNLK